MGLRRGGALFVAAGIAALTLSSGVAQAAPTATAVPAGSLFTSMAPIRVLDTRNGTGTNGVIGPLGAGSSVILDLSANVPSGAMAVVLNLTGVNPTTNTFISMFPAGGQVSGSDLNLAAGEIRANAVTVEVDANRSVALTNSSGSVDVVADLAGYYAPAGGAGFTPLPPTRVLDTRNGTGTPVGPNTAITLDLTNQVPAAATAVTLNLTGTDATANTFVTAWPDGTTRPTASSLNLGAGNVVPNLVTVGLGANHRVDLYNFHGTIDLVADLAGYYATGIGDPFFPLTPLRAVDTRNTGGPSIGPGQTKTVDLSSWLPTMAAAAVFNLTGTNTTNGTFVTAWPADSTQPLASNLNLTPGQTAANLAIVALGSGARLDIGNFHGTVDVIVDLAGYFAAAPTACAGTCVVTWGTNFAGQLGNGTTSNPVETPAQVPGITGLTAIAAGYGQSYALSTDGTVYAWGLNPGNGKSGSELPTPVAVAGLPKITAISAGALDVYAVDVNHTVWGWGPNESGELGTGTRTPSTTPIQITLPGPVTAVVSKDSETEALLADGTVWAWGANQNGDLGNGTVGVRCTTASPLNCYSLTPAQVSGLTNVVALYGGGLDSYAVKADGTVWAWGWNAEGELGTGTAGGRSCEVTSTGPNCAATTPVQVPALTGVTKIAGGSISDYATKADGTVLAWGDNSQWQLGLGTRPTGSCNNDPTPQNCFYPTPVALPGLANVTDIVTGFFFAAAVKSDGTVWLWGIRFDGDFNATQSLVPAQVAGLSSVTAIAAGYSHMSALATVS